MNIKEKISQLIFPQIRLNKIDKKIEKNIIENLKRYKWGGYILFDGEVNQAFELIEKLQENSEIPLFISSDLERGMGQHFKGATEFVYNMGIGQSGNLDNAFKTGKITAEECSQIGINMIYAPVLDINNNYRNPIINIRAYGDNPEIVTDMAEAFISGVYCYNVLPVGKHFPGHGNTNKDSHLELPILKKKFKSLEKLELLPYKKLIENNLLKAIMIGHIAIPDVEENNKILPATLSNNIVEKYLRKTLNFQGLLITDALNMKAISEFEDNIYTKILKAGIDVLLMPIQPILALEEIFSNTKNDIFLLEKINNSFERIQKFKNEFAFMPRKNLKYINSIKNQNFSKKLSYDSLKVYKSNINFPINYKKHKIINLIIDLDNNQETLNDYKEELLKYNVKSYLLNENENYNDYDFIIVSFFSKIMAWKKDIFPKNKTLKFLENLNNNKKVIYVSFLNPYLIKKVKNIENYFCTYSDSFYSKKAFIDYIFESSKIEK
jgi:beta-glucosidase-like glycosyl hydrolase